MISALPKIITTGFKAIQLIYFFTAGEDEVKCWQIRKYSKAPQAAGAQAAPIAGGLVHKVGQQKQLVQMLLQLGQRRYMSAQCRSAVSCSCHTLHSAHLACCQHMPRCVAHKVRCDPSDMLLQEPSTRTLSAASSAPR